MASLFLKFLNMSITAGWLILAVTGLRLLLKKAPKWQVCLLWSVVGIRLVFPFSLKSALSLIPSAQTVSPDILYSADPGIQSGIPAFNSWVNPVISETFIQSAGASVNPLQVWTQVAAYIWLAGMVLLLLYTAFSYGRLKRKVRASIGLEDRVFICDEIDMPFILGLFKPRIYLPSGLGEDQQALIMAHERAHLERRDHWWKPLGFLLLTLYWFNPLSWLAYILLCRDIEMACDEKVVRDLGKEGRLEYSQTLLASSIPHRAIMACPLAFGEVAVKERIRSVLHYKKPAF
ncbi:MAG: transcriptional regulator, partial [Clostridiaceae bacterium]|nr:transcriptional regulator [Clostridiaceae bacterium]